MDSVIVRPGLRADFDAAVRVWLAASTARSGGGAPSPERETQIRANLGKPDTLLLVAADVDTIVGMAVARQGRSKGGTGPPIPGLCFISLVYVLRSRWGEGIGGKLVDALLITAQSGGYDRAHLWTRADNLRAHRLYQGRGFHRTGHLNANDRGVPNVQYERILN